LQKSLDLAIVRTSWLFGMKKKHFVAKILQKMREQKEVFVVADQMGKPTFCNDVVEIALSLFPHQGIFHFANQSATSWYEFAEAVFSIAKEREPLLCERIVPVLTSDVSTLAERPMYSVLDTKKVETLLQISPRPWTLGLQDYFFGSYA
jgi:dTDP-4-dehydrorhamnose reductase